MCLNLRFSCKHMIALAMSAHNRSLHSKLSCLPSPFCINALKLPCFDFSNTRTGHTLPDSGITSQQRPAKLMMFGCSRMECKLKVCISRSKALNNFLSSSSEKHFRELMHLLKAKSVSTFKVDWWTLAVAPAPTTFRVGCQVIGRKSTLKCCAIPRHLIKSFCDWTRRLSKVDATVLSEATCGAVKTIEESRGS